MSYLSGKENIRTTIFQQNHTLCFIIRGKSKEYEQVTSETIFNDFTVSAGHISTKKCFG